MKFDLAFAGGGAKGFAHAGALMELERQGHTLNRLVGTSAGAITATLLAAGYTAEEVRATFSERNADGRTVLSTFPDVPQAFDEKVIAESVTAAMVRELTPPFLPGETGQRINENVTEGILKSANYRSLFSFVELGGFYAGDVFLNWIETKLNAAGRALGGLTLAELHARTGRDLNVVATDTVRATPLVLNHRTAPDTPVAWAVRMSMSIPLAFQEVVWRADWGQYRGRDIDGHTVVDGGVVSTLPLELLLSHEPEVLDVMGGIPSPHSVIGLLIDTNLPVPGAELTPAEEHSIGERFQSDEHWVRLSKRILNLVNTLTKSRDNIIVYTHPECVCRLPAQGYSSMEFGMREERIQLLVDAGSTAMREYLERRFDPRFDPVRNEQARGHCAPEEELSNGPAKD